MVRAASPLQQNVEVYVFRKAQGAYHKGRIVVVCSHVVRRMIQDHVNCVPLVVRAQNP